MTSELVFSGDSGTIEAGGVRPATTLFVSGLVGPEWLVEVDVVARAE